MCLQVYPSVSTDGSSLDKGFHGCIDYIWLSCDLSKVRLDLWRPDNDLSVLVPTAT